MKIRKSLLNQLAENGWNEEQLPEHCTFRRFHRGNEVISFSKHGGQMTCAPKVVKDGVSHLYPLICGASNITIENIEKRIEEAK